jgi:hypothetical protein
MVGIQGITRKLLTFSGTYDIDRASVKYKSIQIIYLVAKDYEDVM